MRLFSRRSSFRDSKTRATTRTPTKPASFIGLTVRLIDLTNEEARLNNSIGTIGHYDVSLGQFLIELPTGEEVHIASKNMEIISDDPSLDDARQQRDNMRASAEREVNSAALLSASAQLLQRSPIKRRTGARARHVLEQVTGPEATARPGTTRRSFAATTRRSTAATTRRAMATSRSSADAALLQLMVDDDDEDAPLSHPSKDSPWKWRPPPECSDPSGGRPDVVPTGSPTRAVRPHAGARFEAMQKGEDHHAQLVFIAVGQHIAPRMRRPPTSAESDAEAAEKERKDLRGQAWAAWLADGMRGGGWWEYNQPLKPLSESGPDVAFVV